MMKIAAGADHAGFDLKQSLVVRLREAGHEVIDVGTSDAEVAVDYPRYAHLVARAVQRRQVDRGLLVCGTGLGMCMAANRYHGVRAANCLTLHLAEMSRRHNDANVICLGGRLLAPQIAWEILELWLKTPFDGGRHERRVEAIDQVGDTARPAAPTGEGRADDAGGSARPQSGGSDGPCAVAHSQSEIGAHGQSAPGKTSG